MKIALWTLAALAAIALSFGCHFYFMRWINPKDSLGSIIWCTVFDLTWVALVMYYGWWKARQKALAETAK